MSYFDLINDSFYVKHLVISSQKLDLHIDINSIIDSGISPSLSCVEDNYMVLAGELETRSERYFILG